MAFVTEDEIILKKKIVNIKQNASIEYLDIGTT